MKIQCGENIKRQRLLNGLSQADLGRLLDVKQGAISSWEINRTEPRMGQIEKMASIFGCTKSELIYGAKETPVYDSSVQEVVALYSKCTPEQKAAILSMLRSFVVVD